VKSARYVLWEPGAGDRLPWPGGVQQWTPLPWIYKNGAWTTQPA